MAKKIPFTDKEMEKAWLRNIFAYHKTPQPRSNAHRLLLFYAVECGLKAMFMKKKRCHRTDLDSCQEIIECGHSINDMLDCLKAQRNLKLPEICIEDIPDKRNNKKNKQEKRKLDSGQINQIWRYGGNIIGIITQRVEKQATDEDIENKLLVISKWIALEIEKL
ncbi:hypothetical protein MEO40_16930 [Dolichospermum sp. ST_sed1]|nr:hypothetical protein [Dolichospermum sp. ST_sed1]MDD1425839.1 hypothetical protein [Dolichospermum sp. ST_sed9]MDD1432773.1 hypothetical protein [Dolichospermum sp. ST_sed6]MDD1437181.1 hypothetical protein [Dolichospermum sp. ST_sed10]MDD1441500.1 hypothetical protein [Dolichospermum sp. ST_sed3]MDD1447489.1 hypothetical protein [Dolichospermum sp. ST_sed8]MDD1455340.1 hypothetical protein [Dolichospermum sp. ST_sed7]MDD1461639.1 hypothetical protein [Dolichospermum sp. ST_sed2]MDD14668